MCASHRASQGVMFLRQQRPQRSMRPRAWLHENLHEHGAHAQPSHAAGDHLHTPARVTQLCLPSPTHVQASKTSPTSTLLNTRIKRTAQQRAQQRCCHGIAGVTCTAPRSAHPKLQRQHSAATQMCAPAPCYAPQGQRHQLPLARCPALLRGHMHLLAEIHMP
jgi:hypothetical protein